MIQFIAAILLIAAMFNTVARKLLGIAFIAYNIYKILGLRKDRFDIEKVIIINGACVALGVVLLLS